MTFRAGMKVVCVEAATGEVSCGREPRKGDIATVTHVYMHHSDGLVLELEEFPQPGIPGMWLPGWLADGFRPVVERKTDIAIFQAMLTPHGVDA